MTAISTSVTTAIALLADLDPVSQRPERVHAVLGWTDAGERHYQPLTTPVPAGTVQAGPMPAVGASEPLAMQLRLDIDGLDAARATSSGRTWRTWSLASVPPTVRHLGLAAAVRELAARMGG